MKNFVFGYARVSTEQQNLDRQLDMLQKYGVDFIYNEKMTGTKRNRPELEKLLERLTEGDTVVVESLSQAWQEYKRSDLAHGNFQRERREPCISERIHRHHD